MTVNYIPAPERPLSVPFSEAAYCLYDRTATIEEAKATVSRPTRNFLVRTDGQHFWLEAGLSRYGRYEHCRLRDKRDTLAEAIADGHFVIKKMRLRKYHFETEPRDGHGRLVSGIPEERLERRVERPQCEVVTPAEIDEAARQAGERMVGSWRSAQIACELAAPKFGVEPELLQAVWRPYRSVYSVSRVLPQFRGIMYRRPN